MRDHISRTCQSRFYHLRRLRSIRKLLGRDVAIQLVCALVFSRLDYCNSVLVGLPASTLAPLQRVLHAAARLVNDLKTSDHVTSTLVDLHWMHIKQRVDYKLCCHVHNVSIGHVPAYLSDMLTACADVPSFSRLRTSSSGDYAIPRTRLKLGERAFAVSAPLAWNKLLRELKKTKCTTTFKRLLKTFLFESAYFFVTYYVMRLRSTSIGGALNRIVLCMLCYVINKYSLIYSTFLGTIYRLHFTPLFVVTSSRYHIIF